MIEFLAEERVGVTISIDGPEDMQDKFRPSFDGIIDLLAMKAYRGTDATESEIPPELMAQALVLNLVYFVAAAATFLWLMRKAREGSGCELTVDLERQFLYDAEGFRERFDMDPFVRERLLKGLDDIAMTLGAEDRIAAFEEQRPPWLTPTES